MTSSSSPLEAAALVVDASVAINLNASGRARDVIAATPCAFLVTANAQAELVDGGRHGRRDAAMLWRLLDEGLVRLADMTPRAMGTYLRLVEGNAASTLDDGEAATIAVASDAGAVVAVDERKARAICARSFPRLRVVTTVDLLLSRRLEARIGREAVAEAVFHALRDARMHVPLALVPAVVDLVGADRVAGCRSLPARSRSAV